MGVKQPMFWESTTTVLRPEERLTRIRPDWHARKARDGERRVFLCEDKLNRQLLLSQKVTLLAEHLSKMAGDRSERISTTAIYNILKNDGSGLNCGYAKHRWRVRAYPMEEGVEAFESARASFQTATILGSKACLQTKICT